MRLLQVCQRYPPYISGIEEHVQNISERLSEIHDLNVYTTGQSRLLSREEIINNVKVRRFRTWAPNDAYYFSSELKKQLRRHSDEFDIVHAHCYHGFPSAYAAQAKGKNKFVFTFHYHGKGHILLRSMLHKPFKLLGKKIFEKSNRVVCVSNYD
jgi:glycosyltransferase involved in cell wall biosynthesis